MQRRPAGAVVSSPTACPPCAWMSIVQTARPSPISVFLVRDEWNEYAFEILFRNAGPDGPRPALRARPGLKAIVRTVSLRAPLLPLIASDAIHQQIHHDLLQQDPVAAYFARDRPSTPEPLPPGRSIRSLRTICRMSRTTSLISSGLNSVRSLRSMRRNLRMTSAGAFWRCRRTLPRLVRTASMSDG